MDMGFTELWVGCQSCSAGYMKNHHVFKLYLKDRELVNNYLVTIYALFEA